MPPRYLMQAAVNALPGRRRASEGIAVAHWIGARPMRLAHRLNARSTAVLGEVVVGRAQVAAADLEGRIEALVSHAG